MPVGIVPLSPLVGLGVAGPLMYMYASDDIAVQASGSVPVTSAWESDNIVSADSADRLTGRVPDR